MYVCDIKKALQEYEDAEGNRLHGNIQDCKFEQYGIFLLLYNILE